MNPCSCKEEKGVDRQKGTKFRERRVRRERREGVTRFVLLPASQPPPVYRCTAR
jgi:hypothetical protein